MPLVSVILPVYNGEKYIAEAIESILTQTFQDFELIIINDGSTDRTEEIIKPYLADNRIKYYKQLNKGFTEAMNQGFRLIEGKYIAYQAHDDISLPTRLEEEVKILEESSEYEMIYSPAIWIDVRGELLTQWGGKERQLSKEEAFYELYINGQFIATPSIMMRKRHVKADILWESPELVICSDFEHFLKLTHDFRIFQIDHPLVKMRRGESHEYLSKRRELMFKEEKYVLEEIHQRFKDKDPKVTIIHYAKSMSNQFLKESLYFLGQTDKRWKGVKLLIRALLFNPLNKRIWHITLINLVPKLIIRFLGVKSKLK